MALQIFKQPLATLNTCLPCKFQLQKLEPANFNSLLHLCRPRPTRICYVQERRRFRGIFVRNAVEESQESSELEAASTQEGLSGSEEQHSVNQPGNSSVELSELGSEIKKAMQQRKEKEDRDGADLWSGVAEEVREIEWPAFGKVLGTTGVVLSIIAGSSVVLLTVNVILAELSDRVFIGKGVQDFLS
ncbi:preprotein translocase subunit SECE1 [Quillaja saponaria]|uniref:Preprotein translocase subunit SECE1 n=1 Tax=Quillaja saponaria TaxID=32244 RepID=A0AAD7VNI9_QUISA|nr:preprotein translocase subunit SECE1 [Quillaja saponaria]